MTVGVVCCRVLESEIRALTRRAPETFRIEIMEWGLHTKPDRLLAAVSDRIRSIEADVDAIVLGYGRCQAMDRLPDFSVPVFRPPGEDCIGVLLGQQRYEDELMKEAGTWFLTPGWTELGMAFVFEELQLERMAERGIDPLTAARRMLENYTRALFIDPGIGPTDALRPKALEIAEAFNLRLETTEGSVSRLRETLDRARQ